MAGTPRSVTAALFIITVTTHTKVGKKESVVLAF